MENDDKEEYDYAFKLVLVGDSGVGKTSLLARFVKGQIPMDLPPTIGVEFHCKNLRLTSGVVVRAQIWDTAGQEKYRAITTAHYRRAAGVLIVYDITQMDSFKNVQMWMQDVYEVLDRDTPVLLVGNKTDLDAAGLRQVDFNQVRAFADQFHLLYLETSAANSELVKSAFQTLVEAVYQRQVGSLMTEGSVVIPHQQVKKQKSTCC